MAKSQVEYAGEYFSGMRTLPKYVVTVNSSRTTGYPFSLVCMTERGPHELRGYSNRLEADEVCRLMNAGY